jgi:nicotinate-nucleotide pyrophosphorylase (carboxylating)
VQKAAIKRFLKEDCPAGDITTEAVFTGKRRATGVLLAKQNLVVSGFAAVKETLAAEFPALNLKIAVADGARAVKGERIGVLSGPVTALLVAERLCLNVLQRMSGIATLTAEFVRLANPRGVVILDTRKTAPGLREWEKRAVIDGGGVNHRMSLSDQYLIKDNHIAAAGSVTEALRRVFTHKKKRRARALVEVEVTDLRQFREALAFEPDIVLLDNMAPTMIREAVRMRNAASHRGAPLLEISGGVTLDNIREFLPLGVERVSIGALTHSARAADISLEVS